MRRFVLILGASLSVLAAADGDKVAESVKLDLERAQTKLIIQRESYTAEKQALAQRVLEKQSELLMKRRQARIARQSVSDTESYLRSLRNQEYASASTVQSQNDALRSYGLQLSTKLLPGEANEERLDGVFEKGVDRDALLVKRLAVLEYGLESLANAIGGQKRDAKATAKDAKIIDGEVLSFGPVHWFLSKDEQVAGAYTISKSGKVAQVKQDQEKQAKALFLGNETEVEIDITGGKAYALASIKSSPIDLVKKGGAWVYPILLLALAALFCVIKKLLELRGYKEPSDEWLEEVGSLHLGGNSDRASEMSKEVQHPIQDVLPHLIDSTHRTLEIAEDVLFEKMITVKENLRKWLPFLAVTAAISPLLGLLGTVSGLIRTFSVIAVEGTGEAQSISGGISEALITTLFGLAVAIPCFMSHALLSRRAKGLEQSTERMALEFLNLLRKRKA